MQYFNGASMSEPYLGLYIGCAVRIYIYLDNTSFSSLRANEVSYLLRNLIH